MSFAKLLYNLPAKRLREVVRRRAGTLRGVPRITEKRALAAFLAEALSTPDSISGAFDKLVQSAGEANRARLERAVDSLELNGLAFWIEVDGRRAVWVPPAVRQHTPVPLPLRYRLPVVLQKYDAARVGLLHVNLKLP